MQPIGTPKVSFANVLFPEDKAKLCSHVPTISPGSLGRLFTAFDRNHWAALGEGLPALISSTELHEVCATNEVIDLQEVSDIYVPICKILNLFNARLYPPRLGGPYIIGIGGSVAAGKSTTARLLHALLSRCWPDCRVELVTTDGFLYENKELERRGLMGRKGFPESYDTHRLFHFLRNARAGHHRLEVPVYSHLSYDIVPGQVQRISNPDVLVVEGLSVLQTPPPSDPRQNRFISDFFDFRIYVHAAVDDLARWYTERFLALKATAFKRPESYFKRYADLSDDEARRVAADLWSRINAPNLAQNIAPSMPGAQLILDKAGDHRVQSVWLRFS